jgi:diguanylate cyclase (GGDEF)-like protein
VGAAVGERRRSPSWHARRSHDRRRSIVIYEVAVSLPFLTWMAWWIALRPELFLQPEILVWAIAIAVVDLMPVPSSVSFAFSLSFPLELSAALLYAPPVAALIAFLGASDSREFKGELPPLKAVFIRSQIAISVLAESLIFHSMAEIDPLSAWWILGPAVFLAAIVGYGLNALLVAYYTHLQSRQPVVGILREMHVGVFGEFLLSYMGLALFSVLVAISTVEIGLWAIVVFVAPLAFARQMFQRTHSLQEATNELAAKQAENEYQALHDSLTGMPNRVLFQQRLNEAIEGSRDGGSGLAVMLMDLDHFKEINDTLGHHFGDMLLREIGPRLSTVLRDHDMMARLGGDEFGILLPDLPSEQVAVRIAQRLLEELEQPVSVEGLALDVSGSVGIAMFPRHADDADTLLRRSDVAMYSAKEAGGGYEVYADEMDRHSPHRLTLVGQVRPAIENSEFVMYYQPKVRLSDGRVAGAEALVRWEHPDRGLVPPDEFIPLVEKTVLLRPLTHYITDAVLRQQRVWADMGYHLTVAVNLSPRSLLDLELPDQVAQMLRDHGVPASALKMELTESFLMADSGRSTAVLDRLSEVGVGLSIDDFGTGYSSLSYLKRLPIQEIKIDRSFVMQMHEDANDFLIVRATVELGRNLGLRTVAEGVEDLATLDRLGDFGCDEAQGYYISRPLPVEDFTRWLAVRGPEAFAPEPPASAPLGFGAGALPQRPPTDGPEPPAARGRFHMV